MIKRQTKPIVLKVPSMLRSKSKLGKAPGAITYVGDRKELPTSISSIWYNEEEYKSTDLSIEKLTDSKAAGYISLIDVVGLSDEKTIANIGQYFNLNTLVLEDLVDTFQRPKIEEFEDYVFSVFKMLYLDSNHQLVIEHIALVLFKDSVVIFQETNDDVFNGVLARIEKKHGRIRSRGADYLFFALLDAIVDNYFVVLENIKEKLELLEDEVYDNPHKESAKKIQYLKKEILRIRKWVYPVKELVNRLISSEHQLISKDTKMYFLDTFDHTMEINEDLALYREMATSLMEMHMTNMSNKMNEVMKVLTVIASIFIPLTFLAGIYGMNFEYMPELKFKYGYFALWGIFIVVGLGLLIYFKKKDWL